MLKSRCMPMKACSRPVPPCSCRVWMPGPLSRLRPPFGCCPTSCCTPLFSRGPTGPSAGTAVPVPGVPRHGESFARGHTMASTAHPPSPPAAANGAAEPDKGPPVRRILIAEDSEATRTHLQKLLEAEPGIQVDTADDGTEALEKLIDHNYSILITDLKMPRGDGMELIEEVKKRELPVTVIVTTGFGGIGEVVQAMRGGAYDFLTKPVDTQYLRLVVQRALRERALQDEIFSLREQLQQRYAYQNMLSKNQQMHAAFDLLKKVAQTNSTVLIKTTRAPASSKSPRPSTTRG